MILWLDDIRDPAKYGYIGARVCRTADEAIALLKTGEVTFASLDHDLAWEHYPRNDTGQPYKEKCGYDVVLWMEQNRIWPKDGTVVHSMNPSGRARMQAVIDRAYGGFHKDG
jgi:hypothetical protein